jgi:hypothetical protein
VMFRTWVQSGVSSNSVINSVVNVMGSLMYAGPELAVHDMHAWGDPFNKNK